MDILAFLVKLSEDQAQHVVRLVKDALEVPFEDLVKNALYNNNIDEQTAEDLLKKNMIYEPLFIRFVETNVGYIDEMIKRKTEWKAARKAVEEDWPEMEER